MVASPPTSQNWKFKKKKTTLCAREVGTTYYIRKIYSASVVDLNIRRRFFGANLKRKANLKTYLMQQRRLDGGLPEAVGTLAS
jgi:hypothetical protein